MNLDNNPGITEQDSDVIKAAALNSQEKSQAGEQKTYLPNQELTEEEKRLEVDNLIKGFTDVLREDPEVQRELIKEFFNYNFEDEQSLRFGSVSFKKGEGKYTIYTIRTNDLQNPFFITRSEGNILEDLIMDRGFCNKDGRFLQKPLFEYSTIQNESGFENLGFERERNREVKVFGRDITSGRKLLAKVQKDFSKVNPAPTAIPH